jgi:toxin ParE1/3/4
MILKRNQAILSIHQQTDRILEDNPEAALRFVEATEEAFSLLEKTPEIGRSYQSLSRRLAGIRIWRVSGFEKHLIFYRPFSEGVEIIDVIHGRRDIPAILDDLL